MGSFSNGSLATKRRRSNKRNDEVYRSERDVLVGSPAHCLAHKLLAIGFHAERNRLAVMFSHLAGLRVGEIAGLRFDDVLETDGSVTDRVHINPAIAKGGVGRTVFVNKRLQREIRRYLEALSALPGPSAPLFRTQKNGAFSANTLCQLFGELYPRPPTCKSAT